MNSNRPFYFHDFGAGASISRNHNLMVDVNEGRVSGGDRAISRTKGETK